jgi:transposase-like protein
MSTETRREHEAPFKKRVVARLLGGRLTVAEAADHYDVAQTLLRRWARDPRFGGKKSAFRRGKSTSSSTNSNGEPTPVEAEDWEKRAEEIVTEILTKTVQICPHCGGWLELPK